jgi:hypothetical protein
MKDDFPEHARQDDGPLPMSIEELLHLMHTGSRPVIADDETGEEGWRRHMGENWGGWRSDGGWGE